MKKYLVLFLSVSIFLASCAQENKLSEEDFKWMPYKGNDTLIFKSENGESDTIFIIKKDTMLAYPEAQGINGEKYEVVAIFSKHSDPNMSGNSHRYLKNSFFKIQKAKDNRTELIFDLLAKDAKFYRLNPVKLDTLIKIGPTTLQTSYAQYDDVYIINPDEYGDSFQARSNFVTKLYWSRSKGLIRYDKKDKAFWELVN